VSRLSRGGAPPPESDGPPHSARSGEPEFDAPTEPVFSLNSRPVAGLQVAEASRKALDPTPAEPESYLQFARKLVGDSDVHNSARGIGEPFHRAASEAARKRSGCAP
jgi:hypothetical protein